MVTAVLPDRSEIVPPLLGVLNFSASLPQQLDHDDRSFISNGFKGKLTSKECILADTIKRRCKTMFRSLLEKNWVK